MIIYAVANNPEVKISDIPISDNYWYDNGVNNVLME
jgi:hypothetical protein